MNRNAAIDLSRAIAVILVTLSHISRGPWLPSFQVGKFDLFGFLQNGWIGVGIFFVISGYCMGISTDKTFSKSVTATTYLNYAYKRFLRIAPPYYISIAVWVFIIEFYHVAPKPTGLRDILTHITFSHNFFKDTFFSISGVYWSIAVEMQFYILLPFLVLFCRNTSVTLIVLFVSLLLAIMVSVVSVDILLRWSLLNYLYLFMYGFCLFRYNGVITDFIRRYKLHFLASIIFIVLLFYKGSGYDNNQKVYEFIVSSLFGLIMIGMNEYVSKCHSHLMNVLLLIGKASFSIYLYNYIYNVVMPRGENYFAMIFMLIGVLGFGVFMYFVVEANTERFRKHVFSLKTARQT